MEKGMTQAEARGKYLNAAQSGDVQEIEWFLQNSKDLGLDINYTDASGLSALNIAIQNGHLIILYPLLKHGVHVNDDLLRAVEHNFLEAVKLLCDFALNSKDKAERRRILDCRCANDDFNHEITPIILAAQKNNFNIIKVLLDAGARIPTSRSAEDTSSDSFQRSVGTLALYRGLASNAYVAMESNDPVERGFTLCGEIRRLSDSEIEYRMAYREMELHVALFATEFISHARSSEEIMTVLSHHDVNDQSKGGDDFSHSALPKISRALNLKLFEFVAHPNCQQVIIAKFYKRLLYLRDKSALYRTMFFAMLLLLYPVLAVLHVYSTREKIKTFVRIPLVIFIMHLASDLTFVILLTWEAMSDRKVADAISFTRRQNFVVVLWIIGMVWQEIESIAVEGVRKVMTQWGHFRNIFIIVLFVTGISFEIAAAHTTPPTETKTTVDHILAKRSAETNYTRTSLQTNFTDGKFSEIGDYVLGELTTSNPSINQTTRLQIKEHVKHVMNYTARRAAKARRKPTVHRVINTSFVPDDAEDFLALVWYHPQIMGRAFLSLATSFSVLRMLPYVVISNVFGPLQISLVRMIKGTYHFFIVLGSVLCSFALGMSLTYASQEIPDEPVPGYRVGSFTGIFQSLISLYWSLFGLMPIEDLHLPGQYFVKETAGSVLYSIFYVLIVIVLLNALIAVWSNLYNEIEENSDVQWKFSRTAMWMKYIDNDVRVPPPFNLLPAVSIMRRVVRMFAMHPKWTTIEVEDLKPTFDEKWLRTRGMPLLIDGRNEIYKQLEKQKSYNKVIGRLRERYVSDKTGDESSTSIEVTKEDIRNLRNDLISLRYETFQKWCHVHEQFGTAKTECLHVAQQSAPVTDILDRAGNIGSQLSQNLESSDGLQSSLCEIKSETSETIQEYSQTVGQLSQEVKTVSAKLLASERARVSTPPPFQPRKIALPLTNPTQSLARPYNMQPRPSAIVCEPPSPEPIEQVPAPAPTPPPVEPLPSTEPLCPSEPAIVEPTTTPPPEMSSSSSTESLADDPCDDQPLSPTIICRPPSSESIELSRSPSPELTLGAAGSLEEIVGPRINDDSIRISSSQSESGQSDGGVHNIVVKLINFKGGEIKLNVKRSVENNRRGSMPNFTSTERKPWQI